MKSHFFAYIARMRYITRWALMRNTFSENVQEHSHMVAVLAHALAVIRNRVYGGQIDAGQVAAVALYHDASEIITGDMPTPIKYYAPEIRDAYKKVEAVACGRLLAMLPDELRPDYDDVLDCADGEVLELVKAADKLSAYIKCVEELKAGNAEFRRAAEQTRAALDAMHLPELDYFMEHCAESFSMTLDADKGEDHDNRDDPDGGRLLPQGLDGGHRPVGAPCARVRGAHPARAEGEERRGGRAEKGITRRARKKGELPLEALPLCCRFLCLNAAICAFRSLHFAAKPL